ncbi:hypothetical protein C8Q80DRAFT_1215067 [Daedaleopsis nitida]|nr:hypothetical protein C8Q80DRAFT_1215067 [Daedaleopsis nitida]
MARSPSCAFPPPFSLFPPLLSAPVVPPASCSCHPSIEARTFRSRHHCSGHKALHTELVRDLRRSLPHASADPSLRGPTVEVLRRQNLGHTASRTVLTTPQRLPAYPRSAAGERTYGPLTFHMFRARNEVPPRGDRRAESHPPHFREPRPPPSQHVPIRAGSSLDSSFFKCHTMYSRRPLLTTLLGPDGFAQSTQRESVRDVWESRNANICAGLQVRIARTRVPPVRSVMARRVPSVSGLNAPVDMSFRTSVSHCDAMHAVSTANPDSPPGTGRTGRRATPTQTPTRRASPDSRTLARRTREKESLELSRTWTPVPRASHAFRLMSTRRSVLRMADENASVLLDRAPWYVS